ncbi:uncharacterized protein LOC111387197 [Olea europaea var. sylvestris]|uniref:uncharacterized protein LOC111387197 n=1 Tax=Olea europaea var. sylvestris TaxID=158386 RepID=UPI000C1D38E9|nr:uncharacterized protein LOC111387197 [Olea europaea var. sylvestris]
MALNAKYKLPFVDGTLKKPSDTQIAILWNRCSDMSLIYCTVPSDIWVNLDNRFSQSNHPHPYRLQCDLINLKQNTMSITTYYNTIKGLWDKLTALIELNPCNCDGRKRLEKAANIKRLFQFHKGLNDFFSNIRS